MEVMSEIRLQKFLAEAGIASRRAAEKLIAEGKVTINDVVAKIGDKISAGAKVRVAGVLVDTKPPRQIYAFNKPRGVISTNSDKFANKTVADYFDGMPRVFPVGRLDKESEGLLLVTNDGTLANQLTHPRYEHEKEYEVELSGAGKSLEEFGRAYQLKTGSIRPMEVVGIERLKNGHSVVKLVLKQGRKRQIREVAEKLGYTVRRLKRTRIGKLKLGSLAPGKWKKVRREDIV
ncbi:MAG: pseudouridine synthase [Patescibacteria group bacterium]